MVGLSRFDQSAAPSATPVDHMAVSVQIMGFARKSFTKSPR
jgi:hypothetical protein